MTTAGQAATFRVDGRGDGGDEVTVKQLNPTQAATYRDGIRRPHEVRTRVHLLDRSHNLVQDLSPFFLTGQTNLQADAPVQRTASAEFTDPDQQIGDPGGGGFARHHMLQAWSLMRVRGLPFTVVEPVFCGPLTSKSDASLTVSVEAQDKGMLALADVTRDSWKAKARAVDVISEILAAAGETRIALPRGVRDRIDERVEIGPDEEIRPLVVAADVASAIGYDLFFDNEGWARMRERSEQPTRTYLADVEHPDVVGDRPTVDEDWADRVNRVVFRGGRGLLVVAELPPPDPNRATGGPLSRDRKPYRVTEYIDNDKVTDASKAREIAEKTLRRLSRGFANVSFTAVPDRSAEPGDVQRLTTVNGSWDFTLSEASIPWGPGAMTVGFQDRVTPAGVRSSVTRRARPRPMPLPKPGRKKKRQGKSVAQVKNIPGPRR